MIFDFRRGSRLSAAAVLCTAALFALPAAASADMLIGITNDDNLISVNTADPGSSTLTAPLGAPAAALGIFYTGGDLYVYDTDNNVLDQVDPATGAIMASTNIGIPVTPGEGDVAFYNGVGYLASTYDANGDFNGSTGTLYQFTLGANSASVVSQSVPLLDGLAFSSTGVLYGLAQGGETLYTFNTATGSTLTTLSTGINDNCGGFACYGFGGLTFGTSGALFASLSSFSGPTSAFFEINPGTGSATALADVPFDQVSGLTSVPGQVVATPEPSFFPLCAAAALILAATRVFSRRASTDPSAKPARLIC